MRCTRITTMVRMTDSVSATPTAWTNPLRDPRDLRLPRIAGPCSIVIFGVTGDLSRKKLLPAIYDLANRGLLPPSFGLTGFARRDWTEDHFRDFVREHVQQHCRTPFRESTWKQLAKGIRFVQGTFDDSAAFARLSDTVAELDRDRGTRGNHAFYMSVPPRAFPVVARQLADCGLARSSEGAWRRVIIEKPFGHDLASAKELDRVVSEVFDPSSVFRIDHYLGKETVQNMLALRFANAMYEPIWNANYVDHVQITMAEDIGVAGRAGYYDGIGAARDIIQNHLLQLLALTAMEEPVSFTASDLTAEKTKILSAVRLPKDLAAHTARGQYAAGWQGSHDVVGYLEEKGIDPASTTETYAAIRLDIDTRRWAGVPFYLRTGKRLGKRVTEIAVVFKRAPHLPFESTATRELGKNAIVIRVQPDEGVTIRFGSKVPGGTAMEVRDVSMDFSYGRSFTESSPEAYERLILDVLLGDPPLFLGFLKGVSFFWTTVHLFCKTVLLSVILLGIFFLLDTFLFSKEGKPKPATQSNEKLGLDGKVNLLLLIGVVISVLMSGIWKPESGFEIYGTHIELQNAARDVILLALAGASLALTTKECRKLNNFTWEPILEVAKLFIGIFISMIPAIAILRAGTDGALAGVINMVFHEGQPVNAMFFWLTGILSSFLDNAPTYLVFFNTAGGDAVHLMTDWTETLSAISAGAVFMGAVTYIGNAPNFMVRSIAEDQGVKMPSFFGYMLWSVGILFPCFALITYLFFM